MFFGKIIHGLINNAKEIKKFGNRWKNKNALFSA